MFSYHVLYLWICSLSWSLPASQVANATTTFFACSLDSIFSACVFILKWLFNWQRKSSANLVSNKIIGGVLFKHKSWRLPLPTPFDQFVQDFWVACAVSSDFYTAKTSETAWASSNILSIISLFLLLLLLSLFFANLILVTGMQLCGMWHWTR